MRVALTFDDGPSRWTPKILDLLKEHDAKATFFVIGKNAVNNGLGLVMKRAVDEGHEIGNHTYTHRRVTDLKDSEVWSELGLTNLLIEKHTGTKPTLWRAPHFDTNDLVQRIADDQGLEHVGYTIDPSDWKSATITISKHCLAGFRNGAIVDLHDGIPPDGGTGLSHRWNTINALRTILETVEAEWVTVSDLAKVPA